jgi:hypothetical protein
MKRLLLATVAALSLTACAAPGTLTAGIQPTNDDLYSRCSTYAQHMDVDVYYQTECGRAYPHFKPRYEQQVTVKAAPQPLQPQPTKVAVTLDRDDIDEQFNRDMEKLTERAKECEEKYTDLKDYEGGKACLAKTKEDGREAGLRYVKQLKAWCLQDTPQKECEQHYAANIHKMFCKVSTNLLLDDGTIDGATCDEWARRKWADKT